MSFMIEDILKPSKPSTKPRIHLYVEQNGNAEQTGEFGIQNKPSTVSGNFIVTNGRYESQSTVPTLNEADLKGSYSSQTPTAEINIRQTTSSPAPSRSTTSSPAPSRSTTSSPAPSRSTTSSPAPSTCSSDSLPGEDEPPRKKIRTSFTADQIKQLEHSYTTQRYLGSSDRNQLARRLKLSDQQVKTWFQNRRMKEKRHIKDVENRLAGTVDSGSYGRASPLSSSSPALTVGSVSPPNPFALSGTAVPGRSSLSPLAAVNSIPEQTVMDPMRATPPFALHHPPLMQHPIAMSLPQQLSSAHELHANMSAAAARHHPAYYTAGGLSQHLPMVSSSILPLGGASSLPAHYPYAGAAPVDFLAGPMLHMSAYPMGQAIL